MKRHLAYLNYVLRHKWFVLVATIRIGAPIWRAIVHDMSKFLPSEWIPYAATFYAHDGSNRYDETEDFNLAWCLHQHRNPHHWQFWLLKQDGPGTKCLPMPKKYALEMVADWMGAGRAITGKWECNEWYQKNKDTIIIHKDTRNFIEPIISGRCTT